VVEVVDVIEIGVVLEVVAVAVVLCVVDELKVVLNVPELLEGAKTPATSATTAATTIRAMIATAITTLPIARLSPNFESNRPFVNRLTECDLAKRN